METFDQELRETFEQILVQISQKTLRIDTLETQNMDNLDFHEVAVWQIKDALRAAFIAGMEVGVTVK